MNTDRFMDANRLNWDERVDIHANAREEFYDIDAFLAGNSTLKDVEISELGDVTGRTLLHLMCHFGLDTLSWSMLGAAVTGVDFSPKAISLARDLAKRSNLDAEFVCADVLESHQSLKRQFDVVFASYGVLCWISDIHKFCMVVGQSLKPGGTFLLVDEHPFLDMFEYNEDAKVLEIQYSYFHEEEPCECSCETSYVEKDRELLNKRTYQWNHDLGSMVSALIGNGMEIISMREYPFLAYQKYPNMVEDEKGLWSFKDSNLNLPLLISVKTRKR